jgi:hypothetical protein
MKTIFFIISLFIVNLINSQIIRIKVYETIEFTTYDTLGILSAVSKINGEFNSKQTNCEYVIDLTNNTDMFFRNGILETEADITFINEGSLFIINFLYEGIDIGVIINTDISNESFDWFSKNGDFYDISKAAKFEIIKSQ